MEIEIKAILREMVNGKINLVEIEGELFERKGHLNCPLTISEDGEIYYDEKYSVHITQKDINAVKIAIGHVECDWWPDFKSIQKLTKIPKTKLQRILHYMKKQKMVKMVAKRTPKESMGILTGDMGLNRVYEVVATQTNES